MDSRPIDEFMDRFRHDGLTFDDVSLCTDYADFLPHEADITTRFSKNISLNAPLVSAAMDTVTESGMAIAMARLGGIGVIHKSLTPEKQAEEARLVKHYLNGLINAPVTFCPDLTVAEMLDIKKLKNYSFSGFPIVGADGRLLGIVTRRDLKFTTDHSQKLSEVMTSNLVTAPIGTPIGEAFRVMMSNKVGKLPILDPQGSLVGLYSLQDVRSIIEKVNPSFNRDLGHRLRVAAAIGPYDEQRAALLVAAGIDALVIDTAHGHSKGVIETVRICKRNYPGVDVVAGNVGSGKGAKALLDAGADAVKVGIGPGSICTTRVVAGVGIPQLSAVYDVKKHIGESIPIIADGGIRQSGDIAKALAAGADCVMMGSVFAGTQESPGEKIYHKGRMYVVYRGMGSLEAMKENKSSRERYGAEDMDGALVPQGIEGLIPFRGSVAEVVNQYLGGLRYSLGYCGTINIKKLQAKAVFMRISSAGLREAHPHDIKIIKEAPNYIEET